ncbi:MAG: aminotransferase class I/II-fold pyridoxal phosphate-dependent enzyme, partial [Thermodesulfovibrionales bacterium]
HKEPWTVNSLAQIAGIEALQDKDFRTMSLQKISEWKKEMEGLFSKKGIYVVPSLANFYLFKAPSNTASILRKKAILIRDCSDFKGLKATLVSPVLVPQKIARFFGDPVEGYAWFRVSVRRPEENERLFKEIEGVF